jgi:hypothetical protein
MLRRVALPPADLVAVALGAFMTLSAIMFVGRYGAGIGLGLTVGACLFVCVVAGFVLLPHVFVSGTIAYFVLLPTFKVFVSNLLGGTKDVISFAALSAALILFVERRAARQRWPIDQAVLVLLAFVVGLYVLNIGGNLSGESGYGLRWFHGVRLFVEPLSLLVVGLSLREPRRTYRWATTAVVWSALVCALYGIFQQTLGIDRLLRMGYDYGSYVRAIGGHLRSFGTLEEPFSYAGYLLIGIAVLMLRGRVRPFSLAILGLVSVGLVFSFVRTALVIAIALLGLALARRGNARLAITFVLVAVIAGATFFALAFDVSSQRSVRVSPTQYLTLNGRTNIWSSALGHKRSNWLLGRGVGAVGTASQRAADKLTGASTKTGTASAKSGTVVDSGYLAAATDIGFVGLAILLLLLMRLLMLGWREASAGQASGWVVLGVLTVILLDALTRESLTGFPTAYVGMLVVGLGLSAAAAARGEAEASPAAL